MTCKRCHRVISPEHICSMTPQEIMELDRLEFVSERNFPDLESGRQWKLANPHMHARLVEVEEIDRLESLAWEASILAWEAEHGVYVDEPIILVEGAKVS